MNVLTKILKTKQICGCDDVDFAPYTIDLIGSVSMTTYYDEMQSATLVDIEDDTGFVGQYWIKKTNGLVSQTFHPSEKAVKKYTDLTGDQ